MTTAWMESIIIVLALVGALSMILAAGAWIADRLPRRWI